MSIESKWWNSSISMQFKKQVSSLVSAGRQRLSASEVEFVTSMKQLADSNDDLAELGLSEWTPSAKQINYVSALYRQYCTEPLER